MDSKIQKIRYRVFEIIEQGKPGDRVSIAFDWFIIILITLSIVTVIVETMQNIHPQIQMVFQIFEIFSIVVFSTEYILRLWTATCNPKYRNFSFGVFRYAGTVGALVDLLAIAPFYIEIVVGGFLDLRFIRIFRLFRLVRILKLGRYSSSLKVLGMVFKEKLSDLAIAISIVVVLIILSASMLFYVEHTAQPEVFKSIPETMWWAVCTLTTIGYGDLVPITTLGRILTALISILSIGIIALPAAMLVSGYNEVTDRIKKKKRGFYITTQKFSLGCKQKKQKQTKRV